MSVYHFNNVCKIINDFQCDYFIHYYYVTRWEFSPPVLISVFPSNESKSLWPPGNFSASQLILTVLGSIWYRFLLWYPVLPVWFPGPWEPLQGYRVQSISTSQEISMYLPITSLSTIFHSVSDNYRRFLFMNIFLLVHIVHIFGFVIFFMGRILWLYQTQQLIRICAPATDETWYCFKYEST